MTQFSTHAEFPVEVVVQHVLEAQKQALEDEEARMAGQSREFTPDRQPSLQRQRQEAQDRHTEGTDAQLLQGGW